MPTNPLIPIDPPIGTYTHNDAASDMNATIETVNAGNIPSGFMAKDNVTSTPMPLITANVYQKFEDTSNMTVLTDTTGTNGVTADLPSSTFTVQSGEAGKYLTRVNANMTLDAAASTLLVSVAVFTGSEPSTPTPVASRLIGGTFAAVAFQSYEVFAYGVIDLSVGDKVIPICSSTATTNPTVGVLNFSMVRIGP